MGKKTKIDWCDSTWNPVTGCLHNCEYCYARRIAERFGLPFAPRLDDPGMEGARKYDSAIGTDTMLELTKPLVRYGRKQPYPMAFYPTFHRYKLDEPQKWKKPRTIFVCSMADLFGSWVPDEWIKTVFDACNQAPQHRYIFLTKNPYRYIDLANSGLLPHQHWYGYTITGANKSIHVCSEIIKFFVSAEPIHGPLSKDFILPSKQMPKWIIMGAETGNRKGKIVPKREWIDDFLWRTTQEKIPVFMKETMRDLMGSDFRQELPWEL